MRFTFSPGELGTFSFSGSATYRSEVVIDYKQPLDFITSPSYTVYDATAEWISVCGSNLDVLVYGKNLSDKLVKLWGFNALGTLGTGILYYSNPRTYGVQLSYHF